MTHKTFAQVSIVILILMALFAIPISANAGGYCGSTYTVQWGDTLGSIAEMCGTTVSELYAANPGISGYLYAGEVLTIPASSTNYYNPGNNNNYGNYNGYNNNYNGYNGNPYNYNYAPTNSNGTYVVQFGDTFSEIAARFGVSMNALWNANPYIGNVNLLYPGQVLNIPSISYSTPCLLAILRASTRIAVVWISIVFSMVWILPAAILVWICADAHTGFGSAFRRKRICGKPNRDHRLIQ